VENEVVTQNVGNNPQFRVLMNHVLFKAKDNPAGVTWQGDTLRNRNPQFQTVDVSRRIFNFRLSDSSPAVNRGTTITGLNIDLDGRQRVFGQRPDLGAFERQN
jgi:hypothetical protein